MKPIPWALPAMAAGAVAWHAFWWGLVRIETVTPVARAAPPPLQLLIESGDNGSARNMLEDIIARYPASVAAGKARTRLAQLRR